MTCQATVTVLGADPTVVAAIARTQCSAAATSDGAVACGGYLCIDILAETLGIQTETWGVGAKTGVSFFRWGRFVHTLPPRTMAAVAHRQHRHHGHAVPPGGDGAGGGR